MNSIGQNEVGAYFFPQATSIKNIHSPDNTEIYDTKTTFSGGFGVNYIHFFNDKYDYKNLHHKIGVRTDLMYSAHNQKFKSVWKPYPNSEDYEVNGKKRLDYLKLAINLEYFHPWTRRLSYMFYGGPQVSYLLKSDGGIVTWRDRDDNDYLYFDLPHADNDYFKKFTLDLVFGAGFDYELNKFVNFSCSARLDFNLTVMDNPDVVVNEYPHYHSSLDRRGSRNASLALLLGLEYTLHYAHHAKTRY